MISLSDGKVLENAEISGQQRKSMICLQQRISRKKKGSRNRKKAIQGFAKYSEHISRIREDRLHKLSHQLANSYSLIAYENLEIGNMVKTIDSQGQYRNVLGAISPICCTTRLRVLVARRSA
jgi:putative transposase